MIITLKLHYTEATEIANMLLGCEMELEKLVFFNDNFELFCHLENVVSLYGYIVKTVFFRGGKTTLKFKINHNIILSLIKLSTIPSTEEILKQMDMNTQMTFNKLFETSKTKYGIEFSKIKNGLHNN